MQGIPTLILNRFIFLKLLKEIFIEMLIFNRYKLQVLIHIMYDIILNNINGNY